MKKILYWTIHIGWQFTIMGVTSEKKTLVHGRNEYDEGTHRRKSDCRGRFPTREAAEAILEGIRATRLRYQELRRPLHQQMTELHQQEERDIMHLVDGAGGTGL